MLTVEGQSIAEAARTTPTIEHEVSEDPPLYPLRLSLCPPLRSRSYQNGPSLL
ncbi:MAG: hypothetical protein AAF191_09970 [Verrucomicrobiota bacterium]